MTNRRMRRQGFTLVELTLVMAFTSILLLAILFITIQSGKLYAKGVTNKNVNQVSRELVDTFRRDFESVSANKVQTPPPAGQEGRQVGRVCTGTVSYVWNTAGLLNDVAASGTKKMMSDTTTGATAIVFQRVADPGSKLCQVDTNGELPMAIEGMDSKELLSNSGRDLAAYAFSVTKIDGTDRQGLYRFHMILGTNDPGTTETSANGYQCLPPSNNAANFDYCTVIEFDAIIRAGGGIQ